MGFCKLLFLLFSCPLTLLPPHTRLPQLHYHVVNQSHGAQVHGQA
jgi:hypothetical protein